MRVCIIVEGCYPYVAGGVSSWVHGLIQSFPKVEFILQTIISTRESQSDVRCDDCDNKEQYRNAE